MPQGVNWRPRNMSQKKLSILLFNLSTHRRERDAESNRLQKVTDWTVWVVISAESDDTRHLVQTGCWPHPPSSVCVRWKFTLWQWSRNLRFGIITDVYCERNHGAVALIGKLQFVSVIRKNLILRDLEVLPYSVYPAVCSLREADGPFDTLPSYFRQISCSTYLHPTRRSSKASLFFRISNYNPVCISHLSHACHMSRPFPPSQYALGSTKYLICHHKSAGEFCNNEFKGQLLIA